MSAPRTMENKPKVSPRPVSTTMPAAVAAAPVNGKAVVKTAPVVKEKTMFEPYMIRVKDGVAQIVGKAGETLVYMEVKLSELGESAKVWVLGMVEGVRQKTEPALKAALAKVKELKKSTETKVLSIVQPIYAKVVDGVVHLQGKMDGYVITMKAQASEKWSIAVTKVSESYAHWVEPVYLLAKRNVKDSYAYGRAQLALTQTKLTAMAQPYILKAKDGSQYVQMKVGNTIVYIKTGVNDTGARISQMAIVALDKAHAKVSPYLSPIIEQAVAMYQKLRLKIVTTLEPLTKRVKKGALDIQVAFNDIVARVRVKASKAMKTMDKYRTECYVKVKNGYLYVTGRIGDTLLSIKVKLTDIANAANMKISMFKEEAKTQLLQFSKSAQAKSAALRKEVMITVSDPQFKVTAASAAGGAAALGASGAATGVVAGAAVGVGGALFTFGLSIPIGAMLGGATGLCVGTVAGAVGGGAAGRTSYKHRDEIKSGMAGAMTKADGYKKMVAEKASDYKDIVKTRVIGGTGGTA